MRITDRLVLDPLRNMSITPPEYVAVQGIGYVTFGPLSFIASANTGRLQRAWPSRYTVCLGNGLSDDRTVIEWV